jgi:hypothetical protein
MLLPWLELKLDEPERLEVEEHLKDCGECRQYFEKMSRVLLPASTSPKDSLEADPYLVTRVLAIGRGRATAVPGTAELIRRWALRSALFAVAVVTGVYMGEKLSYQPTVITDQKIVAEYSAVLDASGIGDRLQTVAQSSGEVSK